MLPNSANVIMAAEHAAQLSDKQVLVAPTTSQQAGLAAAVALAPGSLGRGERAGAARGARRACARAPSRRPRATTPRAASGAGEAVGFVEDEVLAWGDPRETLRAVLRGARGEDGAELISVLAGEDAPLGLGDIEGMVNGGVELELRQGGQPAYWWLLAAE